MIKKFEDFKVLNVENNIDFKFRKDKPAYVNYINIKGKSKTRAEQEIAEQIYSYKSEDYYMFFMPITEGTNDIVKIYEPNLDILKEGLELSKPTFKMTLNMKGLSKQRADEQISQLLEDYNDPNYNIFIVVKDEGDAVIECIYNPYNSEYPKSE
jgi:hypothetical protein